MIKAQQYRPQEQNRSDALERLKELILAAIKVEKARGSIKAGRGKVDYLVSACNVTRNTGCPARGAMPSR